jgi:hypothetical protein
LFRISCTLSLEEEPSCSRISSSHTNENTKKRWDKAPTRFCKVDAAKSVSRSQRLKAMIVEGLSDGCINACCGSSFSQTSSSTSRGYSALKLPKSNKHMRSNYKTWQGAHSSSFVAQGRPRMTHCMRSRPIRYHHTRFHNSFAMVGPAFAYDCLLCAPMSCILRIPNPTVYQAPRCHRVSLWN